MARDSVLVNRLRNLGLHIITGKRLGTNEFSAARATRSWELITLISPIQ